VVPVSIHMAKRKKYKTISVVRAKAAVSKYRADKRKASREAVSGKASVSKLRLRGTKA
jgi:hypothetical protein